MENTQIPDELKFSHQMEGWDEQTTATKVEEYYTANPEKRPAPGGEGGEGNGGAQKPAGEGAAAPAANAGASAEFNFSEFGEDIKSKDDLLAYVNDAREYRSKKTEIESTFSTLQSAKNPIPEKFAPMINFYNQTGIEDEKAMKNIVGMSKDTVKQNPLAVITAARLLESPELAEMGWDKVYKAVAKEHGVNPNIEDASLLDEEEKDTLQIKAIGLFKNVEQKLEAIKSPKDFYSSLQEQKAEADKLAGENFEQWKPVVQKVLSESSAPRTIKITDPELGELSLSVAVGEDTVKNALRAMNQLFVSTKPDEKGINIVQQAILRSAMDEAGIAKFLQDNLSALKDKVKGHYLAEAKKIAANGGDPFASLGRTAAPVGQSAFEQAFGS